MIGTAPKVVVAPVVQTMLPLPSLETLVQATDPSDTEGVGSPVPISENRDDPDMVTVVPPLLAPDDGFTPEIAGELTYFKYDQILLVAPILL